MYTRKNMTIRNKETGDVRTYKSINQAKKASALLTKKHGHGTVRLA